MLEVADVLSRHGEAFRARKMPATSTDLHFA
jgi:hypothetical protein